MSNNKNARLQLIDRIVLLVSSGVESNFQIIIDTVDSLYVIIYRKNKRGQNSQNNFMEAKLDFVEDYKAGKLDRDEYDDEMWEK